MQHTYYVYILECSDKSYYTGVTNNIDRRISEHKLGLNHACYTYKRRPVVVKLIEVFNDIRIAIGREKQIKGWSRKKKEALMEGDWEELHNLAECRNISHYKNKAKSKGLSPFDSAQGDNSKEV